jgi:hypothetical protein
MNGKMTLIANGAIKKAVMAATLLATAATGLMATPAMAQPGWHGGRGWHGGGGWHGRGGGDAGAVIAGGILGVAVGAAIASEHRPYYGGPAYGYYAPPPPPPPPPDYEGYYYRDGYYWDHWGHRYGGWDGRGYYGPHGYYWRR